MGYVGEGTRNTPQNTYESVRILVKGELAVVADVGPCRFAFPVSQRVQINRSGGSNTLTTPSGWVLDRDLVKGPKKI